MISSIWVLPEFPGRRKKQSHTCTCVIQLKASFQETENSITVRSKKPMRTGCIFHIDVFFFPLDIRRQPPVFQISQVVSSRSQAASSILLQINKVNLFHYLFFFPFYFIFHPIVATLVLVLHCRIFLHLTGKKCCSFIRSVQPAYYKSPLISHISFQ